MFSKFFDNNKFDDSTKKIKALQYNIINYDGMSDYIHGGGEIIIEIFIPSHHICFNSIGGVYPSETPNNIVKDLISETTEVNEITEIKLQKELVDKVLAIANLEAKVKDEKKALKALQGYDELFANKPKPRQKWW